MSLSEADYNKIIALLNSNDLKNKTKKSKGFRNYMHSQVYPGALVVKMDTVDALSEFLCEIQALNRDKKPEERIVLRAAGGGRNNVSNSASYSATPVVNADIIVQLTGREFTKITRLPNSNTVRAGASLQIGELDRALYEYHQLVLPTSSLIPDVTVAGLSAAGGHGTGEGQPSFAGLISGVTLMLENGKIVRLTKDHPDFATIMGANNGMFGIVLDVDIDCAPKNKLSCVMEKRSVAQFIKEVEAGLFQNDPYVSAMYMPTYLPDELTNKDAKNVIVYRWRPVPVETRNTNFNPIWSDFTQDLQTKLGDIVNIPEVLQNYPRIIPFYMRHITSKFAIGDTDEYAVGSWPGMMHYRTSFPPNLTEICGIFPVADQPKNAVQGSEIVKALKKAISLLGEHAKRGEYPITYGLYFRFLQGTNGGLSFTSHPADHHVCAMDLTTNTDIPGYKAFEKAMHDFFLDEMKAKFHWGKNAPMDLDYSKLYGADLDATKTALEAWYHKHHISLEKSTLLNPLFSKVLGYPIPFITGNRVAMATRAAVMEPVAPPLSPTTQRRNIATCANKLVEAIDEELVVSDRDSKLLKAQIAADKFQTKRTSSQMFFAKPATPRTNTAKPETPTTPHMNSNL